MKLLVGFLVAAVGTAGAMFATQEQEKQCEGKTCPSTQVAAKKECSQCPSTQTVSAKKECCGKCTATQTVSASAKKECCGKCSSTETVSAKKECCGTCASTQTVAAKQECASCPSSKVSVAANAKCDGCTEESCGEGCAVTAAMAKLPKMVFKVGDETTCCSESAAAMAKKAEKPLHFVVGKKTYEDKTEAFTALVTETESFVDAFVTPKKCEVSGSTTVAGKSCACSVEAGKRTELVSAAVKNVKMEYKVGTKSACCPSSAKSMAKSSGETVKFVVAGEETTCQHTARLNLAKAKYVAAVKAIATTEKAEATTETKAEAKTETSKK